MLKYLKNPDLSDDGYGNEAEVLYKQDKEAFNKKAREWTLQFAL